MTEAKLVQVDLRATMAPSVPLARVVLRVQSANLEFLDQRESQALLVPVVFLESPDLEALQVRKVRRASKEFLVSRAIVVMLAFLDSLVLVARLVTAVLAVQPVSQVQLVAKVKLEFPDEAVLKDPWDALAFKAPRVTLELLDLLDKLACVVLAVPRENGVYRVTREHLVLVAPLVLLVLLVPKVMSATLAELVPKVLKENVVLVV